MFRRHRFQVAAQAWVVALLVACGCTDGEWWSRSRKLPPEPTPEPASERDTFLAETVGAYTLIGQGTATRLRGFGLVAGLGENGGSDCPSTIREYLIDELSKETAPRGSRENQPRFSPQRLIDSLDTAVVVVHGVVPVGAPRGTVFDLQVQAVGTQTRSLEGGMLLPCDLRRFNVAASGRGLVTGRPLARARGLIFTNPFESTDRPTAPHSLRRGYVLGGGKTLSDRTVRLLLQESSYWMARRIERRLNERFGQNPATAEAMSKGYVTLRTPPAFAEDPGRFLELATHLHLERAPQQVERRLRELSRELGGSEQRLHHIALVWEGLGRTVIPHIQPLYADTRLAVRFYAARAGLRLEDVTAVPVLGQIAASAEDARRLLAVRELGRCELPQTARWLVPLLDCDDQQVRIAAYEGLRKRRHPAIMTRRFISALDPMQTNLTLDVVESKGKPLIYARRTLEPRVAVFGPDTPVSLPMFYNHAEDRVTLSARSAEAEIALLCRTPSGRFMPEPLMLPPRVVELIRALAALPIAEGDGQVAGIGLNYAQVVEVLAELCESGTVPARLVMEQASIVDLLGPTELPERPEGDESLAPLEQRPESAPEESAVGAGNPNANR
jgi:hypothetical protein